MKGRFDWDCVLIALAFTAVFSLIFAPEEKIAIPLLVIEGVVCFVLGMLANKNAKRGIAGSYTDLIADFPYRVLSIESVWQRGQEIGCAMLLPLGKLSTKDGEPEPLHIKFLKKEIPTILKAGEILVLQSGAKAFMHGILNTSEIMNGKVIFVKK